MKQYKICLNSNRRTDVRNGNIAYQKLLQKCKYVLFFLLMNKTKDWALVLERELFRSDSQIVFGGLED